MHSALSKAQKLVEGIRFSGDTLRYRGDVVLPHSKAIKNFGYTNELNISQDVTPLLFKGMCAVYDRLNIPPEAVEAFVFASPIIQAECYAGDRAECVLRFSSALVDILDEKEFRFVAGHEIGHFLLGHGLARAADEEQQSIEYYMQQRAQEISVDRAGLLACGSLNIAIKALMKTVSGLTGNHLRFDVGAFLAQLHKSSDVSFGINNKATHPSILIRCRALLWFSLNDCFTNDSKNISSQQLIKIDKQIQSDLDKYVDKPARKQIQEAKEDLAMWMAVYEIVQDNLFTKIEQVAFSKRFGVDTLERLLNFLQDIPTSEVKETVYERVNIARDALESLIPSSFKSELSTIRQWKNKL